MTTASSGGLSRPRRFERTALVCLALVVQTGLRCAVLQADDAPAAAPAAKPAVSDSPVAAQLSSAFGAGFTAGRKQLLEAQKSLDRARKLAPGDPRIDFAHGLILLKQSQTRLAIEQLESAAGGEDESYFPAWQVMIWIHFGERKYDRGFKLLNEFASVVKKAGQGEEIAPDQREAAQWIGQLLECIAACDDSARFREQLSDNTSQVSRTLGEQFVSPVEAGRVSFRNRLLLSKETVSKAASSKAVETPEQIKRRLKQERSDDLTKNLDKTNKAKEKAAKSKEEWQKRLDDALIEFDKQLDTLNRKYESLEKEAAPFRAEFLRIQAKTRNFTLATAGENLFDMRVQADNNLAAYNQVYVQMTGVAEQAAVVVQNRSDAIASYQEATHEIFKETARLDKYAAMFDNKKKKLEGGPAAGKAAKSGAKGAGNKAPATDRAPVASFKVIFPLDFDSERDRLLASFVD